MINERKKRALSLERAAAKKAFEEQSHPQSPGKPQRKTGVNLNAFYQPPSQVNYYSESGGKSVSATPKPKSSLATDPNNQQQIQQSILVQQQLLLLSKPTFGQKLTRFLGSVCCFCCYKSDSTSDSAGTVASKDNLLANDSGATTTFVQQHPKKVSSNQLAVPQQMSKHSLNQFPASNRNSVTQMFDVLHYRSTGYTSMSLGHYSFFSIPVKFTHHMYSARSTYSEEIGRKLLSPGDFALVIQTYFDPDFIAGISKAASHTICAFITASQNSNLSSNTIQYQNLQTSSAIFAGSSPTTTTSAISGTHNQHNNSAFYAALMKRADLSRADFIECNNIPFTLETTHYDRIVLVPVSLKEQRNQFDEQFRMQKEFRDEFLKYLIEFAACLHKCVFVFPKYIKIKEIMHAIHDAFTRSVDIPLSQLNLGVQIHAIVDDSIDVDVVALTFSLAQHGETFAAISHRVFSNINPTLPTLALSKKPIDESSLSQSMDFVVEEDDDDDTTQATATSNKQSGSTSPFFSKSYIDMLGSCSYANLYQFLKELNTCYIIQNHVFQYRTHVLDSMIAFKVISMEFVSVLLHHFEQQDKLRKPQDIQKFTTSNYATGSSQFQNKNKSMNTPVKKNPNNSKEKKHLANSAGSTNASTMSGRDSHTDDGTFREYYSWNTQRYIVPQQQQQQQLQQLSDSEHQMSPTNATGDNFLSPITETMMILDTPELKDEEESKESKMELMRSNEEQSMKYTNAYGFRKGSHVMSQEFVLEGIDTASRGHISVNSSTHHINTTFDSRNRSPIPDSSYRSSENKDISVDFGTNCSSSGSGSVTHARNRAVVTKNRDKIHSLNYYTSSTNNRHVGFKNRRGQQQQQIENDQSTSAVVDQDILQHTMASRMIVDKKKLLAADLSRGHEAKDSSNDSQQQLAENLSKKKYARKYSSSN